MSQERQPSAEISTLTRRGKTIYESNPSVARGRFPTRIANGKPQRAGSSFAVYADDTGEVLKAGNFAFVEEKVIDSEKFVKVYLDGIKQFGNLGKAGMLLFEFVYREISGMAGKDKDTVTLNYFLAQRWKTDLTRRTYERGMSELLEKEFLFRSVATDVYFVNVRFMFNGDRMAVVQLYRRAGSTLQTELPFGRIDAPAIEGPRDEVAE